LNAKVDGSSKCGFDEDMIVLVIIRLFHDINGGNSCHEGIWIHLENQK
jgi:hypothetical protein